MWTGIVEDDQAKYTFAVDREKAALSGIATDDVAKTLRIALGGQDAGLLHLPKEKEPVYINLRLPVDPAKFHRGSFLHLRPVAARECAAFPTGPGEPGHRGKEHSTART